MVLVRSKPLLLFLIILIILTIFTTGCKKKIEEKILENIIEEATGGQVDIDDNTATVNTPEGTSQIGSNLKWPKDKMGDLPELKGNIFSIVEDKNAKLVMLYLGDLEEDNAKKFIETIKELGYEPAFESSTTEGFMYSGSKENGEEIMFAFYNDGTATLSYAEKPVVLESGEESADPSSGDEEIDMTDEVPWPEEFFKEMPEPEGKIVEIQSIGSNEKYIYMEYVKKEDAISYIDKIKEAGFVTSPSESMSGDYISYESGNENGDYIVFTWSGSESVSISLIRGE